MRAIKAISPLTQIKPTLPYGLAWADVDYISNPYKFALDIKRAKHFTSRRWIRVKGAP